MRGEQRFPKQVVEIHGESAISASVNLNGSVCGRQYTIYFLGGAQIVVYIYTCRYTCMWTCIHVQFWKVISSLRDGGAAEHLNQT